MAELRALARKARAAQAEAERLVDALHAQIRAIRDTDPATPLADLGAATGLSETQVSWILRRHRYPRRKPADAPPPLSRTRSDPAAGIPLTAAAQQLGLSRQGLRNILAIAAETPGERRTFDVRGHRVTVVATDPSRRDPWRVWIEPDETDERARTPSKTRLS